MKKIKILLIILFLAFFSIINVSSINIEYVGEADENALRSDTCGGNYCATDLQGSGIRISLLNSDATIIAQVDFWPEKMYNYIKNGDKTNIKEYSAKCKNFKKEIAENNFQKTIKTRDDNSSGIDIGLPSDINDKNASSRYKTFVEQITANSNEKLAKILKELGTNLENAIDNNQILRIEPIYIIREFLTPGYCNDYSGTSYDIINNFGKKYCLNCTETGLGKSYLTGGGKKDGNKVWDVVYNNRSEGGLIHGNWNVIRNYVVSMYVSDNIKNIQKWDNTTKSLSGYTAEDNNLWKWTTENQNNLSQWTQDNKDTLLWMYYNNYKNGKPNIGVGYIKISDFKKPQHTLTVNKYEYVNGEKTTKYVSGASMWVYKSPCESVNTNTYVNSGITSTGSLSFKLDGNATYCVVETKKPSGYVVPSVESSYQTCKINNNTYYCKDIYLNGNKTLDFYNEKTCESEFSAAMRKGEVSMEERIRLFRKYQKDNKKLTNLLNSNKKTPSEACTYSNEKYGSPDISCFKFQYPNNEIVNNFTKENVSKYTDVILKGKKIKFCLEINKVEFEDNKNLNGIRIKSGQKVYDSLPTNSLELKCFEYDLIDDNDERRFEISTSKRYKFNDLFLYKKYRTNLNGLLQYEEEKDGSSFNYLCELDNKNSYDLLEGKETYTYKYKSLSLNFGSGVTTSQKFNKKGLYYRDLKYGIMSRLAEIGKQIIEFKVKYYDYDKGMNTDISTSNKDEGCIYNAYQKITDGSTLNLQFEQVNLNDPFIKKNQAITRKVGSNWRSIDINSFDLNGDGVRNEIDAAIKKYASDVIHDTKASSMGDNYLVKYVMNDRPNSYSKNKPKYVITLTPSDIKAIRNYNNYNDYQDYEKVYCTDSNNVLCSTDFVDNLKTTDPKVCVGDTCEKLSSGINFKREVTGGSDVKDASYIKFSLSNSDYGKIEGDTNIVVTKGDKIEFPELNIKEGYGLIGWITKGTNNKFNYNNYIDISNVTATLGTQEYMAVLAKEHKIYREVDGNNSYVCTVLSRKSMQESGCPRLADPSNVSGFEGWKYKNRVIENYYTRKFITDNDDFIITFTPSYTPIKIYKNIEVVMNNTRIRYSKRGVDIVSKIDKIIGTYSMNGKIFSETIDKNQCEYDGDVHSTRLGKNTFRAICKKRYSKYIDYEIVKVPLDYIDKDLSGHDINALGAGIFTIYTDSNYENEINEAYLKDSENNIHKFEKLFLGLRIDLKEFVPKEYPSGDYWFDLVFKGKNEDLITCKFKVNLSKIGLIPKRDVTVCPEYQ